MSKKVNITHEYLKSHYGMMVYQPTRIINLVIPPERIYSKWEVKRNDLIKKLKAKRALRNRILFWIVFISVSIITTFMWAMFLFYFYYPEAPFWIVIDILLTWYGSYIFIEEKFETDISYITIKRRNKIY